MCRHPLPRRDRQEERCHYQIQQRSLFLWKYKKIIGSDTWMDRINCTWLNRTKFTTTLLTHGRNSKTTSFTPLMIPVMVYEDSDLSFRLNVRVVNVLAYIFFVRYPLAINWSAIESRCLYLFKMSKTKLLTPRQLGDTASQSWKLLWNVEFPSIFIRELPYRNTRKSLEILLFRGVLNFERPYLRVPEELEARFWHFE